MSCRKDGDYVSDLVYSSIADCPTGKWFWISWEPTGLVTLGQGQKVKVAVKVEVMTLKRYTGLTILVQG